MNAVLFAIAEDVKLDPLPRAGVDGFTIGRKINGDLNKATVVFETDVAAHAYGRPVIHDLREPWFHWTRHPSPDLLNSCQLVPSVDKGWLWLRSSIMAGVSAILPLARWSIA